MNQDNTTLSKAEIIAILQGSEFIIYLHNGEKRLGHIIDAGKVYERTVKYFPDRFKDCTNIPQVMAEASLGFEGALNLTGEDGGVELD